MVVPLEPETAITYLSLITSSGMPDLCKTVLLSFLAAANSSLSAEECTITSACSIPLALCDDTAGDNSHAMNGITCHHHPKHCNHCEQRGVVASR
ncbi:Uncharacterized protein BM_BM17076 [Brugia malayi]|uniref:Uncharacterized protein n=1 Tax=Brugia malayi TaxID=6279 RepID=A0A4E9FSP5_BRUMA|nr:Uncharacterized protein BM_BM17076 [Brugia malayi]VIO99647.1 Uncharacterized protein BM_BM17076 [Brugia malayi]